MADTPDTPEKLDLMIDGMWELTLHELKILKTVVTGFIAIKEEEE